LEDEDEPSIRIKSTSSSHNSSDRYSQKISVDGSTSHHSHVFSNDKSKFGRENQTGVILKGLKLDWNWNG